jgi:hypothetical protein
MHAFWEFLKAGAPAVSAIIAPLALIFSWGRLQCHLTPP